MSRISILGVYPITAKEPCHLIEISLNSINTPIKFDEIRQKDMTTGSFMGYILNSSGEELLADRFDMHLKPELWEKNIRVVFFYHYLLLDKPIITQFGLLELPKESPLPDRLNIVEYYDYSECYNCGSDKISGYVHCGSYVLICDSCREGGIATSYCAIAEDDNDDYIIEAMLDLNLTPQSIIENIKNKNLVEITKEKDFILICKGNQSHCYPIISKIAYEGAYVKLRWIEKEK